MGEGNKNHKLTINHTFYSGIIRGAVAKELCKSIYFERHLWHTKDWLSHCKFFPLCCFFPIIKVCIEGNDSKRKYGVRVRVRVTFSSLDRAKE